MTSPEPSRRMRIGSLVLLMGTAAASWAAAERGSGTNAAAYARPAWAVTAGIQAAWQPDSDLEAGGELSTTIANAQVGLTRAFGPRYSVGLAASYGLHHYTFSGDSGFAAGAPWDDVDTYAFSTPLRASLENGWSIIGIPSIRSRVARGADLGDGLTGGAVLASAYRMHERLEIGPGLGVFTELEEDANVFPFLAIDWAITPTLSLGTGRGQGATQGPGLALSWQARDALVLGLGGRYEQMRFRLDDASSQPGGVGEDRGAAVVCFLTRTVLPHVKVNAFAGVELGRRLRVEDADGDRVGQTDVDPVPTMGVSLARSMW